jgi:hypothetical protein
MICGVIHRHPVYLGKIGITGISQRKPQISRMPGVVMLTPDHFRTTIISTIAGNSIMGVNDAKIECN